MILTPEQKLAIIEEYNSWINKQYGSKSLEERKDLDAIFTPPELTIQMLEKLDSIKNKKILDPTCGTGNLLIACIFAGANPKLIYGNEIDEEFLKLAKERLIPYGVPEQNLHQGNVLEDDCISLNSFKNGVKKPYKYVELW